MLDGVEVFTFDFSASGRPEPAIVELPRTKVETWIGQTIALEYRDVYADVYGDVVEASAVWQIWLP